MKIQKNIAATIKNAMADKNQGMVEFSRELGIGKSSLQGYLREDYNMRADTIELVSERLGITPAELVSGPGYLNELQNEEDMIHPLLYPISDELNSLRRAIIGVSKELRKIEDLDVSTCDE